MGEQALPTGLEGLPFRASQGLGCPRWAWADTTRRRGDWTGQAAAAGPFASPASPARPPLATLLANAAWQVLCNHGPFLGAVLRHQPAAQRTRRRCSGRGHDDDTPARSLLGTSYQLRLEPSPNGESLAFRPAETPVLPHCLEHCRTSQNCMRKPHTQTASHAGTGTGTHAPHNGLILLGRPRPLVHIRVEHLLPAVQALDVAPVGKVLGCGARAGTPRQGRRIVGRGCAGWVSGHAVRPGVAGEQGSRPGGRTSGEHADVAAAAWGQRMASCPPMNQ